MFYKLKHVEGYILLSTQQFLTSLVLKCRSNVELQGYFSPWWSIQDLQSYQKKLNMIINIDHDIGYTLHRKDRSVAIFNGQDYSLEIKT